MDRKKRVATGITGLDSMLGGGFIPGSANLVRGAPGTGKTLLGLQFLVQGTLQKEPGLLISFEEFPHSLHNDAESLGWNLHALEEQGLLHLYFTSPQVLLDSLSSPDSSLAELFREKGIRRVLVDSVTHFTRVTNDPLELRDIYNSVVNALKREGATSILLAEEGRGESPVTERGQLSFVVDTLILLRYVEIESAIQRAIAVLKMRGSEHAKEIRHLEIQRGGVSVFGVFENRESILSGISHRVSR
ncbi:MAG TPA: ATPase domain-containing protein [Anaerolineae bacterium]|nr:ATPase domain-containing protein [Anaerolineae bacterium]